MKTPLKSRIGIAGLLATALLIPVVSAQNVGIGTNTPQSKLSVDGTTASGGIAVGDASYTSTPGTVAPLNGVIIQGFTGIGTSSPFSRLTLQGDDTALSSTVIVNSTANPPTGAATPQVVLRVSDNSGLTADQISGRFIVQSLPGGTQANPTGMDALHRGFSGGPLTALRFQTCNGLGPFERMRIDEAGNVGIGDTDPTEARLVVRGGVNGSGGAHQGFTPTSNGFFSGAGTNFFTSIYASNAIVAEGSLISGASVYAASSLTFSDSRLKNVKSVSDSATDLEILKKLHITDYTMKDASALGVGTFKKVIAQQVEEVYPQAVSKGSGYLPDVYALGTSEVQGDGLFEIRLDSPHGLKAGTKVKLLDASGEAEYTTVEAATEKSFTAKLKGVIESGKVFVYGRQVDDLRTVDYEALGMLNVSATQELARKAAAQESRITALEAEVAGLRAANAKLSAITSEMEALKQAVATMRLQNETTARTISITR